MLTCAPILRTALIVVACLLSAETLRAAKPTATQPESMELFAAADARLVELTAIPRDSSRLTLQIKNTTDRPLTIRLPGAFTAVPVLAQFDFFGDNGNGNNGNNANQAVGGPFGMNQGNQGNQGFNPGMNAFQGGVFHVLPGKVIKRRLTSVCLEFGKPEPNPRLPYRIQPVKKFTDDAAVHALLVRLGRGDIKQRVAQLAAWHLASDVSWKELAALKRRAANGYESVRFSRAEVEDARRLLEELSSADENGHPRSTASAAR